MSTIFRISIIPLFMVLIIQCQPKIKGTNDVKQKEVKAVLVTVKFCKMNYPELKKDGVNLYFAGEIINNTPDTIFVFNKDGNMANINDLEKSLFYSIIKGDTLNLLTYWTIPKIKPYDSITIEMLCFISPLNEKWFSLFENLETGKTILDTIRIRYDTPICVNDVNVLPPITFRHSSKFRIDTASYNSYFEGIFQYSDYYDIPVELIEE